jgi:large subunit ribosomal protein L10
MPSSNILAKKEEEVQEYVRIIQEAKSFVLANYRGINVDEDTKLRSEMRQNNVKYKVLKNNILFRALKEVGYEDLKPHLKGPTAFAVSDSDVVAPAKILLKHAKNIEALEIKAGVVEGQIVDQKAMQNIAELPSKEELIAKVLGGLNSPLAGLVNVLNANIKGLVVALNAVAEQKQNA